MNKFLVGVILLCASFCAYCADESSEWKILEKKIIQKRGELKKLRTANLAHIWGEATQSVFLRKRMPKLGENKYYARQVVDVRPHCVCEHASQNDGGTKARHSKSCPKRSLDPNSRDDWYCPVSKLCPAWKQWSDATNKVELTRIQNEKIDPVADELKELEKKFKEHLEERDRERKAAQKQKQQEKTGKKQ